MPTATSSKTSSIRELVESAKRSGLILPPGVATPVKKNGTPATAEGAIRSQWMDVTPEIAQKWLENNFRNRPVDDDTVIAYARDIANGVWVPTHQGIAFNDRDELIDGQHRLKAVIRAGRTVRMMVTFGLPAKIQGHEMTTMDAVDRGRTRSVADQLKIQHNFQHGSLAAGLARVIAALCYQQRTKRLSVGQTIDIIRTFQEGMEWVIMHKPKAHGLRSTGVLAAFVFALQTEDSVQEGLVAQMMERLFSGQDLKPGRPMKLLHDFLQSDDAKLLNRGSDRGLSELVLNAIHLELQGAKVDKLTMVQDGADHFRKLQPKRVAKVAAMFELPKAD